MPANLPERDEKKEKKRRAILDAAIAIFAAKGFHNSRVSDIADAAGVADGTIYLYFRSKDDILITIFEEKMAEMIDAMLIVLNNAETWEDKLRGFAVEHIGMVEENPDLASVLQVELRLSNKFMKEYVPEKLQEYLELVGDVIRHGQKQGDIRPDVSPVIVRRGFFGALDEIAMQWVLTDRKYGLSRSAQEVAEIYIQGLRVGAQQEGNET